MAWKSFSGVFKGGLVLFGRDENISTDGRWQRRQRRQSTSDVNRRPVEKLSLVDVDHEKLNGVDVDCWRSTFIYIFIL